MMISRFRYAMAAKMTFELTRSADGQFAFKLIGDDGQPLLVGEPHAIKASVLAAVASVRKHAGESRNYLRRKDPAGKPFFSLVSSANEVLGTSPVYFSDFARDAGIAACQTGIATAELLDVSAP